MSSRAAYGSEGLHVLFLNAHDGLGADVAVHLTLARALDRRAIRVSAATTLPQVPGASACEAFAAIPDLTHLPLELGRDIGSRHGLARVGALLQNIRGSVNLVWLALWCRRNKVSVIHVTERPRQTLFGLFVARLAGCACVIHAHISHWPHDATPLANLKLSLADAVVGVSRFTADTYVQHGRIDPTRVFAVHNAVDTTAFRPDITDASRTAMRQRLGITPTAPVIGCVARLTRWKGQDRLLEAFAVIQKSLPNAVLVLAGESLDSAPDGRGDYRDYLFRRAEELGIARSVQLPGFISPAEMPHFYGAIDVLAHPSVLEPFGLVVVEAMASGRPVVTSIEGGTPEIIRHEIDGLLVDVDDAAALAAAILRIFNSRPLYNQLAASGRKRVLEAFTPEPQANAMLNVYQRVVARRAGKPVHHARPIQEAQTYGRELSRSSGHDPR